MSDHLPKDEGSPYVYKEFPFASTGPDGNQEVFNSAAEIPAGWTLPDGSKKAGKAKVPETPTPTPTPTPAPSEGGEAEKDAAGTPFDSDRHTGTKTKAGLWRMKVGVSRPASETLDL